MKLFDLYIAFIVLVKICYIITIILKNIKLDKKLSKKVDYYHEKLHVLFYLLMGILLVIMFNPFVKDIKVTGHEKVFIFVLGLLMIIDILKRFFKIHKKFEKNLKKFDLGTHITDTIVDII